MTGLTSAVSKRACNPALIGGFVLLGLAALPGLVWMSGTGQFSGYTHGSSPPGQWAYVLTKLTGLYACLALSLQIVYGLLGRFIMTGRGIWQLRVHRALGIAVIGLAVAHLALYMTAAALRTGQIPVALLLPDFTDGFYRAALSLGWVGLVLLAFAASATLLRRRWVKAWKWVHRLSPLALMAGMAHGLMVGSEARSPLLAGVYAAFAGAVVLAVIWRIRSKPASVGAKST